MHPFALNDDVLDQINGAGGAAGGTIGDPIPPVVWIPIDTKPIEETTLAIGEEGGWTPPPDNQV